MLMALHRLSRGSYSNWAYVVAGHLIESALDTTWEEALVNRLFKPLGICLDVNDAFGAPNGPHDPWGHNLHDGSWQPCPPTNTLCDNAPVMGPAGTFSGPVYATAAYLAFHVRCHNGEDTSGLLSREACVELHTPVDASIHPYALGWICHGTSPFGPYCQHDGSNTRNLMRATLVFERGDASIVFANSNNANLVDAAFRQVISRETGNETCANPVDNGCPTRVDGDRMNRADRTTASRVAFAFGVAWVILIATPILCLSQRQRLAEWLERAAAGEAKPIRRELHTVELQRAGAD